MAKKTYTAPRSDLTLAQALNEVLTGRARRIDFIFTDVANKQWETAAYRIPIPAGKSGRAKESLIVRLDFRPCEVKP